MQVELLHYIDMNALNVYHGYMSSYAIERVFGININATSYRYIPGNNTIFSFSQVDAMSWANIPDYIGESVKKRDELLQRAEELYQENEFEKAIEALQEAHSVCSEIKDKDMQKKIRKVISEVEKKLNQKMVKSLTDSFRARKGVDIGETVDVLTNLVEIFLSAFSSMEIQLNNAINNLQTRIELSEAVREEIVKEIGGMRSNMQSIQEKI
ncbi:hypothetical protein GF325_08420, partial [Candidatus Bathyarchaeota archaeon]|nr:hypothetical protein [Candidatus Bathyarchaeota archaeon]